MFRDVLNGNEAERDLAVVIVDRRAVVVGEKFVICPAPARQQHLIFNALAARDSRQRPRVGRERMSRLIPC